jgi:hypothetical protein
MAGRGPAPKAASRTRVKPTRGTPKAAPGVGWQHGAVPKPPDGLMAASRTAWSTWFKAWWAAHWSKEDLPGLRHVILLYDQVERGEFQRSAELRLSMDTYGITPKGQQDRRWTPPKVEEPEKKAPTKKTAGRYGHLKAVSG